MKYIFNWFDWALKSICMDENSVFASTREINRQDENHRYCFRGLHREETRFWSQSFFLLFVCYFSIIKPLKNDCAPLCTRLPDCGINNIEVYMQQFLFAFFLKSISKFQTCSAMTAACPAETPPAWARSIDTLGPGKVRATLRIPDTPYVALSLSVTKIPDQNSISSNCKQIRPHFTSSCK